MTADYKTSRFIKIDDNHVDYFYYKLPNSWWSRKYEYEWCSKFISLNDVVLDAACGVSHPFKLWCVNKCKEVWASEIDKRLFSYNEFKIEYEKDIQIKCDINVFNDYKKIKLLYSDLTNMKINNNFFDKIFCISVLEHIDKYVTLDNYKNSNLYKSILELKRITKTGGLLIFTFDYPHINIDVFCQIIKDLNLEFLDDINTKVMSESLYYPDKNLYCFRSVLKKI